MASSVSGRAMIGYLKGQDGAVLPTRDYLLYPARKISLKAIFTIDSLLTKLVWSRWLDIGLVQILRVYGPRPSLSPQTHKKITWPISSHLDLVLGQ